jgi:hypothetical protein
MKKVSEDCAEAAQHAAMPRPQPNPKPLRNLYHQGKARSSRVQVRGVSRTAAIGRRALEESSQCTAKLERFFKIAAAKPDALPKQPVITHPSLKRPCGCEFISTHVRCSALYEAAHVKRVCEFVEQRKLLRNWRLFPGNHATPV